MLGSLDTGRAYRSRTIPWGAADATMGALDKGEGVAKAQNALAAFSPPAGGPGDA